MTMEQVLSDRDSEDEVDDDVADLEDRRLLEINWQNYFLGPVDFIVRDGYPLEYASYLAASMLDDFVDVTKDEKQMMHMWNSFVRKQRVLADGHIPWACEGFSKLHGPDLVKNPSLIWCWRLFMIKLWNHGLLDARMMNNCNVVLERCQSQERGEMEERGFMEPMIVGTRAARFATQWRLGGDCVADSSSIFTIEVEFVSCVGMSLLTRSVARRRSRRWEICSSVVSRRRSRRWEAITSRISTVTDLHHRRCGRELCWPEFSVTATARERDRGKEGGREGGRSSRGLS
ncbi:hypothetical protein TIFTF001_026901 [Ficus carica]|uniref:Polycomb protein VEFS-Box domain-containing protein n=1 Tax=Ficus carica TaxID=3494 RepID=A0AA88DM21_FICCA|nr:hypothetical protein TIFTF001_026901 [Ficus carica]